jgi:hypothetical protein
MNKVLTAFAKIKTQLSPQTEQNIKYTKRQISQATDNKLAYLREEKEFKARLKKLEAEVKKTQVVLKEKELKKLQEEITKIFSLPIESLKVVRTTSTTGYLPKILILTKMIELGPIAERSTFDNQMFEQYVGKKLGRFLIQYDWSVQHNGPKISMINITQEYDGFQSATIERGIPCLGNINDITYELFDKKEFFTLTETLLDYLSNTVYGRPYRQWSEWFSLNRPQTLANVHRMIFGEYPSNFSAKEAKVIKEMIPEDEYNVLTRDLSLDPQYPLIQINGRSTHSRCHCDSCVELRRRWELFVEFERQQNETQIVPVEPLLPEELITVASNLINSSGLNTSTPFFSLEDVESLGDTEEMDYRNQMGQGEREADEEQPSQPMVNSSEMQY